MTFEERGCTAIDTLYYSSANRDHSVSVLADSHPLSIPGHSDGTDPCASCQMMV